MLILQSLYQSYSTILNLLYSQPGSNFCNFVLINSAVLHNKQEV